MFCGVVGIGRDCAQLGTREMYQLRTDLLRLSCTFHIVTEMRMLRL